VPSQDLKNSQFSDSKNDLFGASYKKNDSCHKDYSEISGEKIFKDDSEDNILIETLLVDEDDKKTN